MHIVTRHILLIIAIITVWTTDTALSAELSESELKAAFLFNFARFTKWPDEDQKKSNIPFRFCILDKEDVATSLRNAIGASFKERSVVIATPRSTDDLSSCHVLYFGGTSVLPNSALLSAPILIVSESIEVGIIAFVRRNDKIGFIVNLEKASKAQLHMSAQLLKVAVETIGIPKEQSSLPPTSARRIG
jgi:hypothetical protein